MIRPTARLLGAVLLLTALVLVAHARPRSRREFVAAYPRTQGTRLDACVTCHRADLLALNPYGVALRRASFNFMVVEKEDSDADGFANRGEIDLLSFPGDPRDRPGAKRDSSGADSAAVRDSSAAGGDTSAARPDTLRRR